VERSRQINIRSSAQSGRVRCLVLRHKETVHPRSKSKSRCDRRAVGQSVLATSPIWGPRPDFCYRQTLAGMSMWGALYDERTSLSFAIVSGPRQHSHIYRGHTRQYMSSIFTILHVAILHSQLSRVRFLLDTCYLHFYV
jgi:hypothetical protein